MVCIWFGLFFTFRFTQLEFKLPNREHKIYLTTVLLYPLVETTIKWMIVRDVIPCLEKLGGRRGLPASKNPPTFRYSWFLLNRIEHFSWAVAVVIIFLPILIDIYNSLNLWQNLLVTLSFICFLGNLNEFLEYLIRLQLNLTTPKRFAAYYPDTIYDMMMNMIGGFTGFLICDNKKQP